MKTSELSGVALDFAVLMGLGVSENLTDVYKSLQCRRFSYINEDGYICKLSEASCVYDRLSGKGASPSTDWSQGGQIIEQEGISIYPMPGGVGGKWRAEKQGLFLRGDSTPLIAAMRCLVASKFGDEVEVPEELSEPN